jgi:serine/threonine protein kinase
MHKDIKEDNILVRYKGLRSRAQFILADFGFAEAVAQRASSGVVRFSWRVAADRYRAPELYFASKSSLRIVNNEIVFTPGQFVDASVMLYPIDMWSFGVVCCRCFFNVYPANPIEQLAGSYCASRILAPISLKRFFAISFCAVAQSHVSVEALLPNFRFGRGFCVRLCPQPRFCPQRKQFQISTLQRNPFLP